MRILPILIVLLLTSCKGGMLASIKPQPPLVDCTLPMDKTIPDWPAGDDWLAEGKVFAVQLLGVIGDDRIVHGKESECLDALRKKKLIRGPTSD